MLCGCDACAMVSAAVWWGDVGVMRILVVEDEHKINRTVCQALREEAYAVDSAADGEEGEELALVNEYDLIVLDIMLPKKNGIALCRTLRERGITTPILMLTAK